MEYTIPDYYKKFRCIAADCPDTCCTGWKISIDEKTLEKYRDVDGAFGSRLKNSIDWEGGCFHQYEGRCEFLDEDGLCDLQREAGEDMLCRTCRRYPRHVEVFENRREYTLSLSCPEAARLILGNQGKAGFLHTVRQQRAEHFRDYDRLLFSMLLEARTVMYDILRDRNVDIGMRTGIVLAFGHDLQQRIGRGRTDKTGSLIKRYKSSRREEYFRDFFWKYRKRANKAAGLRDRMMAVFNELETVEPSWRAYLKKAGEKESVPECSRTEEIYREQLMIYFLSVYFCGAVYDGEAYAKVKFSALSTMWICSLARRGGGGMEAGYAEASYRFAREIEHSDKNLEFLEKKIMEDDLYSFDNIMILLLN
ncbi:flagellin lysine-N-methylase [Murimonas intestini]|uniref:Lysine-N-methylase n=1 Tax=Murimonas intestini TaxID=1337051 RepID=A0AB73T2Y5_9FIRM|nr:flagellin lysine-N-methylase [Murimonas intestini]MCR1841790.1 flagellin lysine-N-methylase [Murimonas intestini]MCR1865607.1 flagellin lysine-N-methylase [Murimonas intestini]MCR1883812.1 flagellin lysine-N-methylase [Murimonas intestini]